MKRSIISSLCFLFALSNVASSQEGLDNTLAYTPATINKTETNSSKRIITNARIVLAEIQDHLDQHLQYPNQFDEFYNADVTVIVSFAVSKTGEIQDVELAEGQDTLLGKLVVRQLNNLDKVTPIWKYGETVRQKISFPVTFVKA